MYLSIVLVSHRLALSCPTLLLSCETRVPLWCCQLRRFILCEAVFSNNFFKSYDLSLHFVYFSLNATNRIAAYAKLGANSRRTSYFLPFSCGCNSTQVMPFACLDI